MNPIDRVMDALRAHGCNPQRRGNEWSARCPAHDDRKPSLNVRGGDDGRVLVNCHATCSLDDVVVALGLDVRDLFNDDGKRGMNILAEYDYVDERGELLFQAVRLSPKGFRQRRPDGSGGWEWKLDGTRRVLYRLPEVLKGVARGRWILVVEGEKDADRLAGLGFVATCNPGGAGKWRPEYAECLRGAKVAVLADNDDPGHAHAEQIARSLDGLAQVVKVVDLDLPDKGDVSDWLAAGHDTGALKQLVVSTPTPPPTLDATVLDDVAAFMRRFVVFRCDAQWVAVTLWVAHTHVVDACETTPRLSIRSPERESGKTRLLEAIDLLVAAPLSVHNTSEAALFRSVDAGSCTILFDECDATFGPKARDREDLRALLNAGHRRGAQVARCVGVSYVKRFSVFAPVALAGIGALPDTLESRCIIVALKRRAPDEPVERFRRRHAKADAAPLAQRLAKWAAAHRDALAVAEPEVPDGLGDRAADNWEPLLAIADAAGGDWPKRARTAALELSTSRDTSEDPSRGVRLLTDLRVIFTEDRAASGDLCERLNQLEESPWGGWHDGAGLKPRTLAWLLRPYEVRPKKLRIGDQTAQGYERKAFDDVFRRYLPSCSGSQMEHPNIGDNSTDSPSRQLPLAKPQTDPDLGCSGVPDDNPNTGRNGHAKPGRQSLGADLDDEPETDAERLLRDHLGATVRTNTSILRAGRADFA